MNNIRKINMYDSNVTIIQNYGDENRKSGDVKR